MEARLQFFLKIALAFGINAGKTVEKTQFWDKVFFGNYVDVLRRKRLCSKKAMTEHKDTYNQELTKFVNQQS